MYNSFDSLLFFLSSQLKILAAQGYSITCSGAQPKEKNTEKAKKMFEKYLETPKSEKNCVEIIY